MRGHVLAFFLIFLATSAHATVENYDFPIKERYAATVIGTPVEYQAKLPKNIPFNKRRITIFPERELPDVIWYGGKLLYSQALQKQAAPLI